MPKLRKAPTDPVEIVTDVALDEPIVIEIDEPIAHEPEVEAAPVIAPVDTEIEEDDAVKKALDATNRAEELQRNLADANRRADEQTRIAREREEELTRERGDRVDAEYNSVLTALAAEQAGLEQAEAAYISASSNGDWNAAGKAQRAMATASARIDRLEDNKVAFETRREQDKKNPPAPRQQQTTPDFETQIRDLPNDAKSWLRAHPDYWTDPAKNLKIQSLHGYLVNNKGITQFSKEYFDELDVQLGLKAAAAPTEPVIQQQPQRRSMPVSAPVSRDVPGPGGQRTASRITLSPEERDIARKSFTASDMTDEQKEKLYAMNKAKLHRMRANGEYRPTTEQTG